MNVRIAATLWARMRGLLMRPREYLGDQGALLIIPCSSIHTVGMAYPIDVAFIGEDGKVLKAERDLPSGRVLSCRGAIAVLERPSASCSEDARSVPCDPWFCEGDILEFGCR